MGTCNLTGTGSILFVRLVDHFTSFSLLLFVSYKHFFYVFYGRNYLMTQKRNSILGYPSQKHKIIIYNKKFALEKRELETFGTIIAKHPRASRTIRHSGHWMSRRPVFSRRRPFYVSARESGPSVIQAGLHWIIRGFSSPIISAHSIPTLMI